MKKLNLANFKWAEFFKNNIVVFVMLALLIASSLISPAFFTTQNIFNLLRQLSPPTLLAMGMLFVILTGGIDLSVGSVVAMSAVFTAIFLQSYSLAVTLFLVIMIAVVFGAFNGYLVARRRLAPFVVTLAGMTIARGIAFIVSRGQPTRVMNDILLNFAIARFMGVPHIVWFAMFVVIILAVVQRFTVFGRFVQATGSNETAVTLSGINASFYKISVYVISSVLSAAGGIMIASRVGLGTPLAGQAMELDAIAAVVIGGASLSGGRGTVIKTLMGVLVLGMIGNIMNLLNVPSYPQQVLRGIIIIAAVLLQSGRKSSDISSVR
jgi:ribose transport system permease protein